MPGLLKLIDTLFHGIHWSLILFCMFGWVSAQTQQLHLLLVVLIGFSWFGLGKKYGIGYCFVTDWHWKIKRLRGQSKLPSSFVNYELNKIRKNINPKVVENCTYGIFIVCVMISIAVNLQLYPSSVLW